MILHRHPSAGGEAAVDVADQPVDALLELVISGISTRLGTTTWISTTRPRSSGYRSERVAKCAQALRNSLAVIEPVRPEDQLTIGKTWRATAETFALTASDFAPFSNESKSMPIGKCPTRIFRFSNRINCSSPRGRTFASGITRRTHCRKLRTSRRVWNPSRSNWSSARRSRCCCGSFAKMSYGGNGMCRKNVNAEGFCRRASFAQCLGNVHQVIIVDPDEIVGLGTAGDRIRITFVYLLVSLPICRLEIAEILQIVKQRPDHLVGDSRNKIRRAQSHSGPPARLCNRRRGWLWPAARWEFCPQFPANQSTSHRARAAPAQLRKQVRRQQV